MYVTMPCCIVVKQHLEKKLIMIYIYRRNISLRPLVAKTRQDCQCIYRHADKLNCQVWTLDLKCSLDFIQECSLLIGSYVKGF